MKNEPSNELLPTVYAHQPCCYATDPNELCGLNESPDSPTIVEIVEDLAVEHSKELTVEPRDLIPVDSVSVKNLKAIIVEGARAEKTMQELGCKSCVLFFTETCTTQQALEGIASTRTDLAKKLLDSEIAKKAAQKAELAAIQQRAVEINKYNLEIFTLTSTFNKWRDHQKDLSLKGNARTEDRNCLVRNANAMATNFIEKMLCHPTAEKRDKIIEDVFDQVKGVSETRTYFMQFISGIITEITVYEQLKIVAKQNSPEWGVRLSTAKEDVEQGYDIVVEVPMTAEYCEQVLVDAKCKSEFDNLMKANKAQRLNSYLGVKVRRGRNVLIVNPDGQRNGCNPSIFLQPKNIRLLPTFKVRAAVAKDFRQRLQTVADKRQEYLSSDLKVS